MLDYFFTVEGDKMTSEETFCETTGRLMEIRNSQRRLNTIRDVYFV